ncbi:MAG: acyl-CoA dehydrogenase [Burkholderiales bacterium]
MNFAMTDEQTLLAESAARWVADQGPAADAKGTSARWQDMARLGWLGMTLPDADGATPACGLAEACVLAQAFGAGPLPDPFITVIVEAAALLARDPATQAGLLAGIADGSAMVVPAFFEPGGSVEPATRATRAAEGWRLTGRKRPVPFGASAAAWLVSAIDDAGEFGLFVMPRNTAGVAVREFETVDGGTAATLEIHAALPAAARLAGVTRAHYDAARDHAALAACAESVGAMEVLLKATIAYTRTRVQFGKPLAANQVLRHRMADMAVAFEEARAVTSASIAEVAALAESAGIARSRAVAATRAKVATAARKVAEEAIQLHGGMGVTEELSIGRFLRRQLALEALHGSGDAHLRRLAELPEDDADTPPGGQVGDSAFRDEVREFIARELKPEMVRAARLATTVFVEPDIGLQWHRALHRRGWIAPAWPVEYGGTGWSLEKRWIFETECAAAGAPGLSPLGLRMAGPVIMRFGTPEQKAHYLPRILSGEDYWCQGYSEPGSGSDLASLSTRAVRDGDHYVINGTKIWTTHAQFANRMFALVRTGETTVKKHEGISFLLIDMATPGITVRPIRGVSGDHEVNQVFFDDVRVPVSCRLGDEGQGWTVAKYLLEFERGGTINSGRTLAALRRVRRLRVERPQGRQRALAPDDALAFAAVTADLRALGATELRVMSSLAVGQNPGSISSLLKLRWSEVHQAVTRLGLRMLGADALAWESQRPLHHIEQDTVLEEAARPLLAAYLGSRAFTIFGGTSEIQREIIAREWVG